MQMLNMNDFRVGWRKLASDPAYSLVVIAGLAIAIASAYLIYALLVDSLLPDQNVPQPEKVFAVDFKINIPGRVDDWSGASPVVFRNAMLQAKAPVDAAARTLVKNLSLRSGDRIAKLDVMFSDAEISSIFGLSAIRGNLADSLGQPDTIALTSSGAERLFGREDVVNKQVTIDGKTFTIKAILPRQASNSDLQFDALVNFDSPANTLSERNRNHWYRINGHVYARLANGATIDQMSALLQSLFDNSPFLKNLPPEWTANNRKGAFLRAMPLDREAIDGAGSDRRRLLLGSLALAALTMLALAATNYVNLTTVRTLQRQREIGIRKSLGASPIRLVAQFIAESILVTFIAAAFGMVIAALLVAPFSELLNHHFDDRLFTTGKILTMLTACLFLSIMNGLHPARVALGVNCMESLAGRSNRESDSGRVFRKAITILQFSAAIVLSALAIVVIWQSRYAATLNNGFRTDELLAVNLPEDTKPDIASNFHDALSRQSGFLKESWSNDVPGRAELGRVLAVSGPRGDLNINVTEVDAAFFDAYEIKLRAGDLSATNTSDNDNPVALDGKAAELLGFDSPGKAIGQTIIRKADGKPFHIVAVTENVKLESARNEAEPQLFVLGKNPLDVLTLRSSDIQSARQGVEALWPRYFPDDIVDMDTVDNYLAEHYDQDKKIGRLIAASSLISMLLASFGIYALASYSVRRRTQEIVIRKLYGASHGSVVGLLVREFGTLFLIGAAIGLPLAWLASQHYLSGFVERAPIGAWPLTIALLVAILVATLAVLRHTFSALAIRPILALR